MHAQPATPWCPPRSPCSGAQSYLELLADLGLNVGAHGCGDFKGRGQTKTNRSGQASRVDAAVHRNLECVTGDKRDGAISLQDFVLDGALASGPVFGLDGPKEPRFGSWNVHPAA